jgi:ribosomal protein S18 acetylase RimI-like enzyme
VTAPTLSLTYEGNPYAFLAHHGASPHVRLDIEPDCMVISAASDARPFNTFFAPAFAADGLGLRVREVTRLHLTRGRPPVWWIGPSATPAGLPEALVALGFAPMAPVQLMEAQLTEGNEIPSRDDADVRPVRTRGELAEFVGVHSAAYGSGHEAAHFTHRVLASLSLTDDAPLQHFLGRADGAAVAVSSAFRHDGVAGLYNVAVVPAARGRGHGTAATRAALADSYARGLRTVTLGAEAEAVGMYRRLGFTDRGQLFRVAYSPGSLPYGCPHRAEASESS